MVEEKIMIDNLTSYSNLFPLIIIPTTPPHFLAFGKETNRHGSIGAGDL
jgi:hypothetical protein